MKQDVKAIFKKLPGYVASVGRAVTDLAAGADRFMQGDGMEGEGLKQLYKKTKKGAKKQVAEAKEVVKDASSKVAKTIKDASGQVVKTTFASAVPIAEAATLVVNTAANKKNLDALQRAGATILSYGRATAADAGKFLGRTIRVASGGAIKTGQVVAVVGNVLVIVGTATGQPEIVATGLAMDTAGDALELTGRVGVDAATMTEAALKGDKKQALAAFLRAANTFKTGLGDMLTDGAYSTVEGLIMAAAKGDGELAQQAAAQGALAALGKGAQEGALPGPPGIRGPWQHGGEPLFGVGRSTRTRGNVACSCPCPMWYDQRTRPKSKLASEKPP